MCGTCGSTAAEIGRHWFLSSRNVDEVDRTVEQSESSLGCTGKLAVEIQSEDTELKLTLVVWYLVSSLIDSREREISVFSDFAILHTTVH